MQGQEQADDGHWRAAGGRIDALLDATSVGGIVARERAEQLVREVVDLYGEGLTRVLEILAASGGDTVERLTQDDLVASLLLVHGLHPHDVPTRVLAALDSVRPYLGSHGGDVDLVEVAEGTVRLRLTGSCESCPSSAVTLELAVKDAVLSAAPEIAEIEVMGAKPADNSGLFSPDSLFAHVRSADSGAWVPAPDLADLEPGQVGGFDIAGVPALGCRIGSELFVYRDQCASCALSLAGAVMQRRAGGAVGEAVLRCPNCRAHFDVRGAGRRIEDEGGAGLTPLPVLVRSGVVSVAVPTAEVAG